MLQSYDNFLCEKANAIIRKIRNDFEIYFFTVANVTGGIIQIKTKYGRFVLFSLTSDFLINDANVAEELCYLEKNPSPPKKSQI